MTEPRILDGKAIAAQIRADIAADVDTLLADGGRQPKLVAVLVGEDPASKTYVASKTKGCQEAGLLGETLRLPADIEQPALLEHLRRLNEDETVDGILVQLPLPGHLDERRVVESVIPAKDVDGFHPQNVGRLWLDQPTLAPATPSGILELLQRCQIPLKGRRAVIVGRSAIVGKPMAALLLAQHCTVTLCHSRTQDLPAVCREADILVGAVGRAAMIGPDHVREGAVVIDVGINQVTDAAEVERLFPGNESRQRGFAKRGYTLVGDVDYTHVLPKAGAITPVPGGVGPLTVAMVIANTVKASRRRQGREG